MWAIVAHLFTVEVLIILFIKRTRLSLLGNAWSAFAQVAESREVDENTANMTLKTDSEVSKDLDSKKRTRVNLEAKIVAGEKVVMVTIKE